VHASEVFVLTMNIDTMDSIDTLAVAGAAELTAQPRQMDRTGGSSSSVSVDVIFGDVSEANAAAITAVVPSPLMSDLNFSSSPQRSPSFASNAEESSKTSAITAQSFINLPAAGELPPQIAHAAVHPDAT